LIIKGSSLVIVENGVDADVLISFSRISDGGEDALLASFAPSQTLRTAETCCEQLLKEINNATTVVLDAGDVTDVDLTFLQSITALCRTAAIQGISLTWAARPAPTVRELADRLGFTSDKAVDGRFWLECPQ
jgi:anti-anti-sigma regulatory factor